MTPLPNAESIARVSEDMDQEQPTYSSSSDTTTKNLIDTDSISEVQNSHLAGLNLYSESDRLRTFTNWKVPFINACDLAAAGFYYTNRGDVVRCPYCDIEVGRWEIGDDPETEHQKHSPNCKYILQVKQTRSDNQQRASQSSGEDSCGPFGAENQTSDVERRARDTMLEQLKINSSDEPMFPRYSTYEERLKSFENWPATSKIAPDVLSVAGFVYSKIGDRTFCFHCGGRLQLWDDSDEPWVEHAHWFPKCKYVLSTRGQKFIEDARVKKHEGLAQTQKEMKNVIETIKEIVSTGDVNNVNPKDKLNESSSEGNSNDESTKSEDGAESQNFRESRMMCLICLTEERTTVLLPCFHMVACGKCVKKLTECCVCRTPIIYRQRVYIP